MTSATAEKKPAAKKAADKVADKAQAPKKEAVATRPQRVSARINLTTTKTIEGQFDTTSKKVEELDKKLVEASRRFVDKPEHQFAVAIEDARTELKAAAEALVTAKDKFAEIGTELRDFFG